MTRGDAQRAFMAWVAGVACVMLPPWAQASTGSDTTARAGNVLLSASELADVRAHPAAVSAIVQHCPALLDFAAAPQAVLAPPPHYTAVGVNHGSAQENRWARDALSAFRAALCYQVQDDERYAAVAQRILDAWAQTLVRVATPQGRANVNFNAPYLIVAASGVRGVGGWNSERFDRFLRSTLLPQAELDNPNNHGAWAVLMAASAAAYLHDSALLTTARERWASLLRGAIAADGTLTREITRSGTSNYHGGADKGVRGLAYTHYFLLPASLAAKVFADQGQPVWLSDAGKLLGAAFSRAAGWTLHPETFPYYRSNQGQLQDTRNVAYFALLLRHYPERDARTVLEQGDMVAGGFMLTHLFPLRSMP